MSYGYRPGHTVQVFERISHRAVKTVDCPGCQRKLMRTKTFAMTVNPWNKNPDGTERSRDQIRAALAAEAKAWQQLPAYHTACEP